MSSKWFDISLRRQKTDSPNGKVNVTPGTGSDIPGEAVLAQNISVNKNGKTVTRPDGDLQSAEDIYRSAGIMNPRMGYSISKIAEMLNSDHIRSLSNEAKRAAILMALDAAGVPIDEVLRDATLRRDALNGYENSQQKHFEEYWEQKDRENAQIQIEMERMTAQCLDRIKRNLDQVMQEKGAFSRWQTLKQQETERIAEAVRVCSKPPAVEPTSNSLVALRAAGPAVKPS